jgi:hypothetical protein
VKAEIDEVSGRPSAATPDTNPPNSTCFNNSRHWASSIGSSAAPHITSSFAAGRPRSGFAVGASPGGDREDRLPGLPGETQPRRAGAPAGVVPRRGSGAQGPYWPKGRPMRGWRPASERWWCLSGSSGSPLRRGPGGSATTRCPTGAVSRRPGRSSRWRLRGRSGPSATSRRR